MEREIERESERGRKERGERERKREKRMKKIIVLVRYFLIT